MAAMRAERERQDAVWGGGVVAQPQPQPQKSADSDRKSYGPTQMR